MLSPREVRRCDCDGVEERAPAEQPGKRVGERIAHTDVVLAALRGDVHRGVRGTATKVIFAIGADTEVGGVAVQAHLSPHFEGVAGGGEGKILAPLEEIAVDADDAFRPAD